MGAHGRRASRGVRGGMWARGRRTSAFRAGDVHSVPVSATEERQRWSAGVLVTPTVRLVAPLGAGGMGAVWVAEHTGLRTKVVVKFMHDELDGSESARSRFSREATAAAQTGARARVRGFRARRRRRRRSRAPTSCRCSITA